MAASAQDLHQRLQNALQPRQLEVIDDSHLHAGHAGAREGRHFTVRIASERFAGLSRIARHRLVYHVLGDLASQGIHALAVEAQVAEPVDSPAPTPTPSNLR